jgi:hypothetical protein
MKAISMLPSGVGVTVEKLDKIYFCIECRMVFLFRSDAAADYERMSGSASFYLSDLLRRNSNMRYLV